VERDCRHSPFWQAKGLSAPIGEADFPDSSSRRGPSLVSAEIPSNARELGDGSWMDPLRAWGLGCCRNLASVVCLPSESKAVKSGEQIEGNAVSLGHWVGYDLAMTHRRLTAAVLPHKFTMLLRALSNFPRTRRDLPLRWISRDNDSREGARLGGRLDPRVGEVWWE
jgi:hypothetical protein